MAFGFFNFDFAAFEQAFQTFVRRGGLDETRSVSETFERSHRQNQKVVPETCRHGLTRLTCSDCYLNGWKDRERGL